MEMTLVQKQSLKLAMTAELRQSIDLLQYNMYELNEFITVEAEKNPLIDISYNKRGTKIKNNLEENSVEKIIENLTVDLTSLEDHLINQLHEIEVDKESYNIIKYLIYALDDNGYMKDDEKEICETLKINIELFNTALETLQEFDPIGVGARNLSECLSLQLKNQIDNLLLEGTKECDNAKLAYEIVHTYFHLFSKKKFKEISTALKVDDLEFKTAVEVIKSLNPKPGSLYASRIPEYIVPDIVIENIDGEFKIKLNEDLIPNITINEMYRKILLESGKEEKQYLSDKLNHIRFIANSLEKRRETITSAITILLRIQKQIFLTGNFKDLKPLTMKELALEMNVHESTISRTVKGKFIETSHGVYEMKKLFSQSINKSTSDSCDASQSEVQSHIKDIINNENKRKPLSDQKIVNILKDEYSIDISRRTVAKYRDQMNILSSSDRKQF